MDPGPSLRVLVVDDCADSTESLALLLRLWGYESLFANNGKAALALAREQTPDVVILDLGMPEMSGWELARHLRELPELRGVFLIALSGHTREEDQRRSSEAGCDLHLTKPLAVEELCRLLGTRTKERRDSVP